MYKIIYLVSVILRTLYGPNPFEFLPNGDSLNLLFGGILIPITYLMVKVFYRGGSFPEFGAFCFLILYFVNGYVFKYIMFFYPHWWLIGLLTIVYLIVYILVLRAIYSMNE